MGAAPGEAYVGLGLPPGAADADALALVRRLAALAERTGTTLAGGDVTAAPGALAVGDRRRLGRPEPATSSAATARSPGDLVGVTGALGARRPASPCSRSAPAARRTLVARHLRPEPRLAEGRALGRERAPRAMIDLSDGLATDAGHVADAQRRCGWRSNSSRLPLAAGVAEVASALGADALDFAATGGEDYELLFCAPPGRREAIEAIGEITWIGTALDGAPGCELTYSGKARRLSGFEHGA